jgi:hypothetical protein
LLAELANVKELGNILLVFPDEMLVKTSIIFSSIASSNAYNAPLVHSRGCFSENSSAQIPEQATSWYSISWTVLTNALVDLGGFHLRLCLKCF